MDTESHKMTQHEWQMFNHQKKLDKVIEQNRFYCLCGHSMRILPSEERVFCYYCGHWVYRDKRKQNKNIKRIKMENFRKQVKERINNVI